MKVSVQVSAPLGGCTSVGWVNGQQFTIDRAMNGGRSGEGATSGELLCLALGAGYADELLQEATRQHIRIDRVHMTVEAESGNGGRTTSNLALSVRVESDADEPTILDLIEHTDRISTSLKLLRVASSVRVVDAQVLTRRRRGA